jgi:hypothetical protein
VVLFVIVCEVVLANNRHFRRKNRYRRPEMGGCQLEGALLSAPEYL